MEARVEGVGEDLEAFDQTGAGASERVITHEEKDALVAYARQRA